MKKERKKNKITTPEMDLSIIKENDLENTATFTDLMSRKERKKHKKEKDINLEENTKNEDSMEFETEELSSQIAENKTVEISEEDIKAIANADINEDIDEETIYEEKEPKEFKNIFNTVFISLILIVLIGLYVYAITYTKILEKDLYLKIDGFALIFLVFNYCLMTISRKKVAIFFTIINYLTVVGIIALNTLIYLKIF